MSEPTTHQTAADTAGSARPRPVGLGTGLLAALLIVSFCVLHFSDNKADVDLWGNTGFVTALPWQDGYHDTNTYSFTEPQAKWFNHEWLAEYFINLAFRMSGTTGMLLLKLLLDLCVIGLIASAMSRDRISLPVRILVLLLIISTMGYGASTRPHHFTYLMLAGWLWLLTQARLGAVAFGGVGAACGLLWANLHGAFFIGALLLIVYTVLALVQRGVRSDAAQSVVPVRSAAAALVCFLVATLANPYGLHLWDFLFQSAAKARPNLSEWAMFNPVEHAADHADFMALAVLSAVAVACSGGRRGLVWPGILVVAFGFAIAMRRNIPLFAIAAGFIVPRHLDRAIGDRLTELCGKFPRAMAPIAAVALSVMCLHTAWTRDKVDPLKIEIPQDLFPTRVMEFLVQNEIRGNALIFFDWAEYAIWHLDPRVKVFLDGRYRSAYSLPVIEDYFGFLYVKEHWRRALDEYPTDILMLHKQSDIFAEMTGDRDWELVYADNLAGLFLKTGRHDYHDRARAHIPAPTATVYFP